MWDEIKAFIESRVLWVVMAFAAGVIVSDIADEHRYGPELARVKKALSYAQQYADACGPGVSFIDLPAAHARNEAAR